MRLLSASLALLGVEVAMAATSAPDNASPTRPRAPGHLQETSRRLTQAAAEAEPTAVEQLLNEQQEGQATPAAAAEENDTLWYHQEAKRQQITSSLPSTTPESDSNLSEVGVNPSPFSETTLSASATPSTSGGGGIASVLSQSDAIYETSTSASLPLTTSLAFFTAADGVYSVSDLGSYQVVAGKTISVGGADAIVGGDIVSLASSGLYVGGTEVEFETVTYSASSSESMSISMSMSESGMAGTSSSSPEESASGVASESSPGAAVPRATAGAGMVAAVGAVVGLVVL